MREGGLYKENEVCVIIWSVLDPVMFKRSGLTGQGNCCNT